MLSRLFDSVGFPWAVRIMAFMNFGLQAVAIPLVRERLPHRLGLPLVDRKALTDVTFFFHMVAGFLAPFGAALLPSLLRSSADSCLRRTVHAILVYRVVQSVSWY